MKRIPGAGGSGVSAKSQVSNRMSSATPAARALARAAAMA